MELRDRAVTADLQQSLRRPPGTTDPVELDASHETLKALLRLRERYGNIASMRSTRGRDAWFVNEPAAIRQILVRDHAAYTKGSDFERVKLLLGKGIFVSDGAHWRRARTMAQPAFTRRHLRRLIDLIVAQVEARARAWSTLAEDVSPVDITTETNEFALELILRAIFGADYDERIVTDGNNPFSFLAEEQARDIDLVVRFRDLRSLVREIIARRTKAFNTDGNDFLSVYLQATDKAGNGFSDRELMDEVMTLVIAGFETSASTLNWAWYHLATQPGVAERIAEESERYLVRGRPVDANLVEQLSYAERFINETLRLFPPGWIFSRRARVDTVLDDFDVPAGTEIFISPYILHRSAEFWPEPASFDVNRFLPDRFGARQQAAFIPFSLGPRRCIGEYFAMLEMKIHLALLVRRFKVKLTSAAQPSLDLGINLRSAGSIFLQMTARC